MEKEVKEKKQQQKEEDIDLTPREHERAKMELIGAS